MQDDALILLVNRIAENSVASPEVLGALAGFGYDEVSMQEGKCSLPHFLAHS